MSARLPAAAKQALRLTAVVTVVGLALAALGFFLGLQRVHAEVDRATALVTGRVVENEIGDEGDIRVAWRDPQGREHVQRFAVYSAYDVGEPFDVRYDPRHPGHRAFPADEEETDYEDGYYVGIGGSVALGLLLLLGLGLRWWWWRRAVARPAVPVRAVVLSGAFNAATTTWFRLGQGERSRWQMVMWDPALEALSGPVEVRAHGDLDGRRRVAVELPDGPVLVCQGRLRHKEPSSYAFQPRPAGGRSLAEALVLPAGAVLPQARPWWRAAVLWGGGGAALGLVLAFLLVSHALPVLVACAAGLGAVGVNLWTLNGAEQ